MDIDIEIDHKDNKREKLNNSNEEQTDNENKNSESKKEEEKDKVENKKKETKDYRYPNYRKSEETASRFYDSIPMMNKASRVRSGMKCRKTEQYKKRKVINNAILTTAVGINKDKNTNIKYNNQLNKMMKMLQEVDSSFTILPWNPESNEKRIHSKEDIPEYEEDLMRYVRNIRVIEHFNACQMT